MTPQEQIRTIFSEKQQKKKFQDVQEQDWTGAVSLIKYLLKKMAVKEQADKINADAGTAMYDVLVRKHAEAMVVLNNYDMEDPAKMEILERWIKNSNIYENNFKNLKLSVSRDGNSSKALDGGGAVDNESSEDDSDDDDYPSPESFSR